MKIVSDTSITVIIQFNNLPTSKAFFTIDLEHTLNINLFKPWIGSGVVLLLQNNLR